MFVLQIDDLWCMACNFSIPVKESPESLLNKARAAVVGQGGNFDGDAQSGSFNVTVFGNRIAGNYNLSGSSLYITVTDKPMLISCGMIESYLKGQIN